MYTVQSIVYNCTVYTRDPNEWDPGGPRDLGGAGTGEEGEEGEEGGKKEGRKRLWKASNGLGRLENAIGMHA